MNAMSFPGVHRSKANAVFHGVYFVRYEPQMIDIEAGPIPAAVIDLHSFGNRPVSFFPAMTMNVDPLSINIHATVSVFILASQPDKARTD